MPVAKGEASWVAVGLEVVGIEQVGWEVAGWEEAGLEEVDRVERGKAVVVLTRAGWEEVDCIASARGEEEGLAVPGSGRTGWEEVGLAIVNPVRKALAEEG